MALEHEGIQLSQQYLFSLENDQTPTSVFEDNGEMVSNGDPFTSFVGDPDGNQESTTDYGYGTYAPNIARVASSVGGDVLWSGSGLPDSQLYAHISQGHPVVAWVDDDPSNCVLQYSTAFDVQAADGVTVPYPSQGYEHTLAVIGVSATEVYVLNSLPCGRSGWIPKSTFESSFATFGNMAVVIS